MTESLDAAMLEMKRHEGSPAFAAIIRLLSVAEVAAMYQMRDTEGDESTGYKGLSKGLALLRSDLEADWHRPAD